MSTRPLILLDVDGVLNVLTIDPGPGWERHTCQSWNGTYRVRLNPSHGPMLLELAEQTGAELVWATTWTDDANREIGPKIGLPKLPVIDVMSGDEAAWVNTKVPPVAMYINSRPFVWFDDDLDAVDRAYLADHAGVGDFLIVDIPADSGLSAEHLQMAADWLSSLAAPRS
ncbi:hypothetical protein FXF51_05720 [Nonomuraea sp. PA05]|uniref:HAD domain-containing protein n=1 Tax=Nonomuraea sp. PA05 TaxID=2604466 RepID=UPI0011D8853E|nr:HAD domain-containing protein [Nonomuraea sp. PA05]TYB69658.1 hypothetical protein FXF51_05720 [Nonomuraea sp. PA05]